MQKFTIAKDEKAVLQVKFLTSDNELGKIHEGENASWICNDTGILKIISTDFDGANYNVTVSPVATGVAILTAKGNFLGNDRASENDFFGYEVSGCCQIEVRPALVKGAFFTLSHRVPKI